MTTKPERLRTASTCARILILLLLVRTQTGAGGVNFICTLPYVDLVLTLDMPKAVSSVVAMHQRDIKSVMLSGRLGFDCLQVAWMQLSCAACRVLWCRLGPGRVFNNCECTLQSVRQRSPHCTSCMIVSRNLSSASSRYCVS